MVAGVGGNTLFCLPPTLTNLGKINPNSNPQMGFKKFLPPGPPIQCMVCKHLIEILIYNLRERWLLYFCSIWLSYKTINFLLYRH